MTGSKDNDLKVNTRLELLHFAAIIANTDDAVISKDLNGTILSWNPSAERIFGYTSEEIVGKNILQLIPENKKSEEDEILAKLRRGEKLEHYITKRQRKDGSLIDISLTVSPIKDENGKIIGASKIARDISSLRIAQRHTAMLAAVVDSSNDAIISKDLDGTVTSWNNAAEQMFGYKSREIIGKNITTIIPEDLLDEESMIISRIRKGEQVGHFDSVRKNRQGELLPVSLTISPIFDNYGKVVGASKIVRDISERKAAEKLLLQRTRELERSNKELDDFAYVISHDLKAPIRAIRSLAHFLVTDFKKEMPEAAKEHIRLLVGRVRRMDDFISGLLEYSRLSKVKFNFISVDIFELISEVVENLTPNPHIQVDIRARGIINFERIPLLHIFQNLLSNAFKYADKPGGKVICDMKRRNGSWEFSVSDNGPGIAPKYHRKIFEIFQRLNARDKDEGTGIGLTIVKKLVDQYGGRVWIESVPGKGATFFFTLPVQEDENSEQENISETETDKQK